VRLREELREEVPIAYDLPNGANEVDKDDFADLPDDGEAEEAAAEKRALMASFETKRHDDSAPHFMVAERKAAAARLAMA
jgi:hypothetical protein